MASPAPISVDELLQHAQAAFSTADFALAARLAGQALADPALEPGRRVPAVTLHMNALYRQGALAQVVEHLHGALAHLTPEAHAVERFELLRMGSMACCETRRFEEALRYAHEAMVLAGEDARRRVLALNAQAACFERMGDPWQASRLMEAALALLDPEEDPTRSYPRLLTLNNLCATLLGMFHILRDAGEPQDAQAVLERAHAGALEALPLAVARGEIWPLVFIEGNLAEAQVHLGEPEQALQTLTEALQRAQAHGFKAQTWAMRCTWAEACLALGRAREAQAELEDVLVEIGDQQPVATLMRLHHALYRSHAAQGSVARALHSLEQYLALERQRTSRQLQAQSRVLVTRLQMEQPRRLVERARDEAREHRRRADAWADAALRDPLTGLLNRRGLVERVEALAGPKGPLAVVMVDIDHFKRINDTHGHAVGDAVLARIATLLRAHLRPEDILARFGGEEFTLLLTGLDEGHAIEVCERLRQGVEQEDWSRIGNGLRVTASVGLSMAGFDAQVSQDLARLLEPADAALYRAKHRGRNRVEVAATPPGDAATPVTVDPAA
jgi:diguanylate cyclase (GGDEF)-like protein